MIKYFAPFLMLILPGCSSMSRAEVIAAAKECTEGGLQPLFIRNGFTYEVMSVTCNEPRSSHERE